MKKEVYEELTRIGERRLAKIGVTKKNVNGSAKPIHTFRKRTSLRRLWRPIPLYISSLIFLNCLMQKSSSKNFRKKDMSQSV